MIQLVPVKKNDCEILAFIERVYIDSFPIDERRNFQEVVDLLEEAPAFQLRAICAEGVRVGFLSYWKWEHLAYVEHFAIESCWRGSGYGADVLNLFLHNIGLPVVLEVEKPEDDFSRRRIAFYERLGFHLWSEYPYVQPPYDKDRESLDMYLMTYGDLDLRESFESIKNILYKEVYNCKS